MTKPSNLYAEKIYSENPISLWALDDKADFISLFTEDDLSLTGWTLGVGNSISVSPPSGFALQIEDSPNIKVQATATDQVNLTSGNITNFNLLDTEKDSFNFGFFFNPRTPNVTSVKIGYTYETSVGGNVVTLGDSETFTTLVENSWVFLNKTFKIPKDGASYLNNTFKVFIEIRTSNSANNEFYINGMSLGQWSEPFHTESTGVMIKDLPTNIALTGLKSIKAKSYGIGDYVGYYLSSPTRLYSYNEGFPIVYGASNLTKIIPNLSNGPSLIIPGLGFMNESGRYREYSFEMWLRVTPETELPRRIFGPISSNDGLYVNGKFLTIKLGSYSASHYVGEWGRPMLIQILINSSGMGMLVNGEKVVNIDVDKSSVTLPAELSSSGKDQDWLGFYAYSDVPFVEIDCPAIFSYEIPDVVAKRRFVYGQGVDYPELTNSSFGGNSAVVDYSVSNYSNNYMYPDNGSWTQGIRDNVLVDNNILSLPEYTEPKVVFKNSQVTYSTWLGLCKAASAAASETFVNLSLGETNNGYILFDKYNPLSQNLKSIHGVFKSSSSNLKEILFKFENKLSGNSITISLENGLVSYEFRAGALPPVVFQSSVAIAANDKFAVGLDLDRFTSTFGGLLSSFFSSSKNIELYVGGQKGFENCFTGNIYSIGFSTVKNHQKVSSIFATNGTFVNSTTTDLDNFIASYTLKPQTYLNDFVLDISADAYWQDYVPLKYFGKNVTDKYGNTVNSLDYIQFNIDVPALRLSSDNGYNSANSEIRTYVSFQSVSSGANRTNVAFPFSEAIPPNGVVMPEGNDWLDSRYEVVNDSILYMPKDVDFRSLALVIQVEIKSNAISKKKIRIRSLQLASQVLSKTSPTTINTKMGIPLNPYVNVGVYEDYEYENPISITKNNLPYLYLSEYSGIRLRGNFDDSSITGRGIRMPINQQRSSSYSVGAIQLLCKYTDKLFPVEKTEIYKINSLGLDLVVYVEADNLTRTRGRVFVANRNTGLEQQAITLYLNGVPTKGLYINSNQWNMIGMQFTNALSFNNFSGSVELTGPMLFNNVSEYRITTALASMSYVFRTWGQVLTMDLSSNTREDDTGTTVDESNNIWQDFIDSKPYLSWENVLFIPTNRVYLLDPQSIYKLFAGTNKVIVQNDTSVKIGSYKYSVYKDISWSRSLLSPV